MRCLVQRHEFNKSLLLWLTLLVLLILAAVFYPRFNPAQMQDNPAAAIPEHMPAVHPVVVQNDSPETAAVVVPNIDLSAPETLPAPLDPETARAAVHRVENGVYERATALFEREAIDTAWAGAYEQSLREMFSQHRGLQRVSVNSIRCHATMCRIEVFTPRDADADYFTAMFYDALERHRAGELKAEAAIARRMELGMTSVYVARKEHRLGFY